MTLKLNSKTEYMDTKKQIKRNKSYFEKEAKELAWKAYISRTTEEEFFWINKKHAKSEFEKWWIKNNLK